MDNIKQHEELMSKIHETYIQKNKAYGNSFDKSLDEFGPVAALTRMSDKWNRLKELTLKDDISVGDEPLKDTVLDLANYCVMYYMWLNNKEKKDNE